MLWQKICEKIDRLHLLSYYFQPKITNQSCSKEAGLSAVHHLYVLAAKRGEPKTVDPLPYFATLEP